MEDFEGIEISTDFEHGLVSLKIGDDSYEIEPEHALFMAQILIEKSLNLLG